MIHLYIGEELELLIFQMELDVGERPVMRVDAESLQKDFLMRLKTPDLFQKRTYFVTTFAFWDHPRLADEVESAWKEGSIAHDLYLPAPSSAKHSLISLLQKEKKVKKVEGKKLLPQLVQRLFEEKGCSITPDALEELLFRTGERIGVLRQEVEKLTQYKGEKGRVVKKDVEALVEDEGEEPFGIQNALREKNPKKLWDAFQRAWLHGTHPHAILSLVAGEFRRMLLIKEVLGESPSLLQRGALASTMKEKEKALKELGKVDSVLKRWVTRPGVLFYLYRGSLAYTKKELGSLMGLVSRLHRQTRERLSEKDMLAKVVFALRR